MDNIVVTPHIAGAGLEVVYRHSNMLCDDFFALLKGEMPKAIINPEAIDDFNRFIEMAKDIAPGGGRRIECSRCSALWQVLMVQTPYFPAKSLPGYRKK